MAKSASAPGMSVLLVSYVPMLVGEAGASMSLTDSEDATAVTGMLDQMPSGSADACLWVRKQSKSDTKFEMAPVLLYPGYKDLVNHFMAWCESEPTKWFHLHLREKNGKYALALMPDLPKSIERHRMIYQLRNGYPLPKDTNYTLLFRSLHFVSGTATTFESIRHSLPESISVGFLDTSLVDPQNMQLNENNILWIGPFKLAPNRDCIKYLDGMIDDAKEPNQASIRF